MDPSPTRDRYFLVLGAFFLTRKRSTKFTAFSLPKTQNFITKNFWDRFHVTFSDLPKLRNQEKGVLAKGFF